MMHKIPSFLLQLFILILALIAPHTPHLALGNETSQTNPLGVPLEIQFYRNNPKMQFTHTLPMEAVFFNKSSWKIADIRSQFEKTAEVYSQCGVKLEVEKLYLDEKRDSEIGFDLDGYDDPRDTREYNGSLEISQQYKKSTQPTVFFIESFDPSHGSIAATSVTAERITQDDQKPALNSVWITYQIQKLTSTSRELTAPSPTVDIETVAIDSDGYSVLGHELGHVLLNSSHVTDISVHNLMHEQALHLNGRLTNSQCEKIKSSELVKKINSAPQTVSQSACPNITSPLRGTIIFSANSAEIPNACGLANKLIHKLTQVNDTVSDLQPVHHVDFFFSGKSDTIQYVDRNAFELSLIPTFYSNGEAPLNENQSDILIIHELGHAIFNAQLSIDWPWYQQRQKIYQKWGQAVVESIELEDALNKASDETQKKLLQRQMQDLKHAVSSLHEQRVSQVNSEKFDRLMAPYHELFADTIVLIYTMDPHALKMALANPDDPLGKVASQEDLQALEERDFSYLRDPATWKITEPHAMLTPVQAHFWSLIKNVDLQKKTKPELLRRFYVVIKEEILTRTANPALWKLSVKDANERLIKATDSFIKTWLKR